MLLLVASAFLLGSLSIMFTNVKNWIYQLIVGSQILHRFLPWFTAPYLFCLITFHKADLIQDDSGFTMRVTHWNDRPVSALWTRRLSTMKSVKIRHDDVMLCSYPKTGSHWMHEILQMVMKKRTKATRCGKAFEGMLEFLPDIFLDSFPSPRTISSHLYYEELPSGVVENKTKIILMIRCPKDTVVSFYNHTKNLEPFYQYGGNFNDYFKMFVKGKVDYGSYFDYYKSWNKVIKSPTKTNEIFVLEYEELRENTVSKIMEVAQFLGIEVTKEFATQIARASDFSKMKKDKPRSPILRKGIVGDWTNWLTEEQSKEIDTIWREQMTDLKLPIRGYCD